MGNISIQMNQPTELQHYSQIQHRTYGYGDVYLSTKFPHCFIIKLITKLVNEKQLKLFSRIQNQQNIYLLSLYGYMMGKNCNCQPGTIIQDTVISFWEYLHYTLLDIIEIKDKLKLNFHEWEIWHIIKAAIYGYQAFNRTLAYYDFSPVKMMVNEQGRIRLSWFHLQSNNTHLNYYQKFNNLIYNLNIELQNNEINNNNNNNINQQHYFSPQQMLSLQKHQITHKLNFEKCNIYSLGITLLYCCTLMNPNKYFYRSNGFIDINYVNCILTNLQKIYSKTLLILIGLMLSYQIDQRISFQKIRQIYGKQIKAQYQIQISRKIRKNLNEKFHKMKYS